MQRSCRAVGLSRSAWYRGPSDKLERDRVVIEALQALVEKHRRWGFWKCYRRLRLDGRGWNHKRVYRVLSMDIQICAVGRHPVSRTSRSASLSA